MVFRTIPQILPRAMYRGVTEPRDKVFALFNIATEPALNEFRTRCLSLIDYDLPLRIVYIRACELWHAGSSAFFALRLPGESSRELSFLDWVLDTEENDKISLPSWVPHWMQKGPTTMVRAMGCEAGFTEDESSPPAHVLFPSLDQYALEEVPLTVRGIILFKIHRTGGDVRKVGTYVVHATMLSDFSGLYPTTKLTYLEAYSRAMVPEAHSFRCADVRTLTFWELMKDNSTEAYDEIEARETAFKEKELTSALPASLLASVLGPTKHLAVGRSFFTSTNGFMGLAPLNTEPGDFVGLFFGGRTPYVVRKLQSGKYRFIGACFPLGVMQGEALDGYPKQKVMDFVLV